jgi:hypothetical protein
MNKKPIIPAWLAALLGGLTYLLIQFAIESAFPDHWAGSPDRLLGMSYAGWSRLLWIPEALLLIGLIGVYRHLAEALGKLGKTGYWLAVAGFGLNILGIVIEFWIYGLFLVPIVGEFRTSSAGSNLGYAIASVGGMILIVGLLIFGIACLRARIPTRWRFTPLAISISYATILYFFFTNQMVVHGLLYGTSWMLAGYFLQRDSQHTEWRFI